MKDWGVMFVAKRRGISSSDEWLDMRTAFYKKEHTERSLKDLENEIPNTNYNFPVISIIKVHIIQEEE